MVLPLWPRAEKAMLRERDSTKKSHHSKAAPQFPHSWVHRGTSWVCVACLAHARNDRSKQRKCWEDCNGLSTKLAAV
eukprot:1101442-Karenia_brevis.AAC.1